VHDIPRTGTVRAHSELEVLEIDTATFLDTVAGNVAGTAAADSIAAGLGHGA
jgi:CRP-like cAMP-binding protein